MFTGIVVAASGRGFWFIEQEGTRDCVFVHQRNVVGKKVLHRNDRVRFNLAPNPRKPGELEATDVEIFGVTIAHQASAKNSNGGAL